jgi:glyoxylase-like metal-dependent hydrolase (beta-lactamase superfamily II)
MKNGIEQIEIGSYRIDVIVQGFPGKAEFHGYLGWSTVALLRGHGRVALIDVGSLGMRKIMIERLAECGVTPTDVTDVLLTHSHHDHAINWTLFSKARIVLGALELDWAVRQPWGETSVPELYIKELQNWPTLQTVTDGQEVMPKISAHLFPGHTPGCLAYVLRGTEFDVIFTGDSAKNRAELVSGTTDMTYDAALSAASIKNIWVHWCSRPGNVIVPGHDLPMTQEGGITHYIGKREAAIVAYFGDDTMNAKRFPLT